MLIIPLMYSVKEYVDLKSDVGNVTNLPHCDANFETSKRTLDYLAVSV